MEVDFNLTKLANIFKFFLCILEKSLKIDCGLLFLGENPFLPNVIRAIHVTKWVLCQIFEHMFIPERQFIVAYWLNGPFLLKVKIKRKIQN